MDDKREKFTVQDLKTRLDRYLAGQLKNVSRSQIQRGIEAGLVTVNGQTVNESKFVVRVGDEITYSHNDGNNNDQIKPTNTPLKVLYHDHGLLIIDKPAGMVVHPGAGFKGESLASALLYHFKDVQVVGEDHRPGIVHRLDKDTSGVILVATTPQMYEHLKDAFKDRKIKKEYVALVEGKIEKPHGFIDAPIGKSKADFRKMDTQNVLEAKEAVTEYRVLEHLSIPSPQSSLLKGEEGKQGVDEYTLVMVKLHTGRTHQIRVHFKSLGYPLAGDELYGRRKAKLKGLSRQFLHAKKIEVQLPDGTWIEAESELASDLKDVLKNLHSKIVQTL